MEGVIASCAQREEFWMVVKLETCPCFAPFSCNCEISGLQRVTAVEPKELRVPERERSSHLVY